ncbi:formylmethanofuran dehydrogenase [Variovorax sp. OV329]|uniref:formylmethanofuran dehydrogenase n=1 Tax=Variovorax sp. OV329 TaxID=1882825 RepID=UPI0020C90722|nr:formylmethanofuran dehydrogenase [Variovorax sp. OV329]
MRWTSPFCLLLCDTLGVRANASGTALELAEGECAAARLALARFPGMPSVAAPQVDGLSVDPDQALDAAARILADSRQPLFGGLGTDVAGARALYRLATETGAICDAARGPALMHTVRTLQDRGGYSTTLAEVRNRADLLVFLGGLPGGGAAEFMARCGVGEAGSPPRHLVLLGGSPEEQAGLAALTGRAELTMESLPLQGDLFDTVALLSALVARRAVPAPPPGLAALAERLLAAHYAVLVGQTDAMPAHGNLLIEAANRIVATLNTATRAAAMWLGGGNGAGTVNEVFTWLSGLPLRSRNGPGGVEHDPLCFDTARLLAEGAADSLLWVSCFDPDGIAPGTQVPLIVLGHPDLAASAQRVGSVFLPVSTPGIGSPGHLFRADGGTVLPLVPLYRDTLPTLAEVLGQLLQRVQALRAKAVP